MDPQSVVGSTEFIASMAGAFAGAGAAFLFQAFGEIVKERNRKHSAIILTQAVLGMQLSDILHLKWSRMDRLKTDPKRHVNLHGIGYDLTSLRVDFTSIVFLGEHYENSQVISQVMNAESKFLTAVKVSGLRNEAILALKAVQKAAPAPIESNDVATTTEWKRVVELHLDDLKHQTDQLYFAVEKSSRQLHTAIKALSETGKSVLPDKKFARFKWSYTDDPKDEYIIPKEDTEPKKRPMI